jgi:hypothetical protein
MSFDVDIFISYAHIDNLALKEGDNGWIANFHKALDVRLAQLIGERIGNKSRIFKIIKTAVPFNQHPPEISDTLGYEFFIADADTGKTKELHEKCPGELEQMYWSKLDDIAHDIRDLLLQLKETGTTPAPPPAEQLTVYLAETTSDLKEQRDMIKRELMEYGYRILPDNQLPFVASEFTNTVSDLLDQSVLSVHLVGACCGLVPEGSNKSVIMLQNELAAQKSKTGKLQRLIWLTTDSRKEDEKQKQFISLLRSSPDAQQGADLFETSIEDFKSAVHDKLDALQAGTAAGKNAFQSISTVYLAETNQELREKRENIKRRLLERGCTVLPDEPLPLIYSQVRETVGKLLAQCDISIHILGEHYGVVPEETEKSILSIQNELAAEKSEKGKSERLVWISPLIDQTDERQKLFIDIVKTGAADQPHTDIFETSIDEMEAALFEKLESLDEKRRRQTAEKTPAPAAGEADEADPGPRRIYLVCDQGDLDDRENDHITRLEDFLFDSGFDVVLPIFEGKEEDVMNDHHENLKTCDAAVIYYGTGSELWLRSITRDLTKIAGYGRPHPLLNKTVFLGPPGSRQKERFRSHDLLVINGLTGFSPSLLDPFVEKLK